MSSPAAQRNLTYITDALRVTNAFRSSKFQRFPRHSCNQQRCPTYQHAHNHSLTWLLPRRHISTAIVITITISGTISVATAVAVTAQPVFCMTVNEKGGLGYHPSGLPMKSFTRSHTDELKLPINWGRYSFLYLFLFGCWPAQAWSWIARVCGSTNEDSRELLIAVACLSVKWGKLLSCCCPEKWARERRGIKSLM